MADDGDERELAEPTQKPEPAPEPVSSEEIPAECELAHIVEQRRKKRKEKEIEAAVGSLASLSSTVQQHLLKIHLKGGWGMFSHGMARHFKAPSRYGHKLVDLAILTTVHDRTVALVAPHQVMFVALTIENFVDETGMDESNIRKALRCLVSKGALLKIEASYRIFFWALNPHYFTLGVKGDLPPGKPPRGKLPEGNAPRSKTGSAPRVMPGQITPDQPHANDGNNSENPSPKNPSEESKKESLSTNGDFPADMLARWTQFQKKGLEPRIWKEREIFQKLFLEHKDTFYAFCGRVVEFLEEVGTGRAGQEKKIQYPMTWMDGHWEANLALYRTWKTEQETLERAHAERLEREAKDRANNSQKTRQEAQEQQANAVWQERMNEAALRFLAIYESEEEINAFSEEAVRVLGNQYIEAARMKYGWQNSLVRSCVLEHFMKVESGAVISQIRPQSKESA